MDRETFKQYGHELIEWIAEYYEHIEEKPVRSQVKPNEIMNQIPQFIPEQGTSFSEILNDFENQLLQGITHWQHPSFHAYFSGNTSFPSILGELLTSVIGAQCMLWETSPAATELEERVVDWLKHAMKLSDEWSGVIQDAASTGTLSALLTAREQKTGYAINDEGYKGNEQFTVYASEEAHSSIEKAVKIAGIGAHRLRKIPLDESFALLPEVLSSKIEEDLDNGYTPLMIVAAIGTIGSLAIDPVPAIASICKKHNIWLHIDAAYLGTAALCPEYHWIHKGAEHADSYVFNPHKWLFTNFDCSVMYIRDKNQLIKTFEILPEYLKTSTQDVNNYKDWGIQLGRRFRALKLWMVIRSYGLSGIQQLIRKHISIAHSFKAMLERYEGFEILAPMDFTLVCFRYKLPDWDENTTDEFNAAVLAQINSSGAAYITHTRLNNRYTLRAVFSQTHVEHRHAEKLFGVLVETIERVKKIIDH